VALYMASYSPMNPSLKILVGAAILAPIAFGSSLPLSAQKIPPAQDRSMAKPFRDCPDCPEMVAIPAGHS
jgi:hypothetical protein